MKYIQALAIMALLIASKRYRQKWRRTADRVAESMNAVEASFRRIDALENGGRPRMRLM